MNEAYHKALLLLHKTSTPAGFVAAVNAEDNYHRVWTRNSTLCGLAALSTDDEELKKVSKNSIETILRHQHRDGFIPSNVGSDGSLSYGTAVGRVDNHAWIVIAACTYAYVQGEDEWLQIYKRLIAQCFQLMNAWEFNGRGLMYVPQSADWADEYHHHGYILYNQLLRLWALRCAATVFNDDMYRREEARIKTAIETYFGDEEPYTTQNGRLLARNRFPYFLMGFNTAAVYTQFDLQANALALLLRIGPEEKRTATVEFMAQLLLEYPSLWPSFTPPVLENETAMLDLKNNYAFRFRNSPHRFHNGGLWPVWNGLAALSLTAYNDTLAQKACDSIYNVCSQNYWEFNECFHGLTHQGDGVPYCASSAAGAILATNRNFASKLIL